MFKTHGQLISISAIKIMMTSLWIMMCLRCLIEDDSKLGNTQLVCLAKTFTFLVLLHAIEFFTVWGKII
jgi:hypothetical protein